MKHVYIIEIMCIYFMICKMIMRLMEYLYWMFCTVLWNYICTCWVSVHDLHSCCRTKGKQVPEAWWDVGICWAGPWKVWVWRATTMFLIFLFMSYGYCYFKFRIYEFENCNLNILLVVCKLYKSSKFSNLLVNFCFTNGVFTRWCFR